MLQNGLLLSAPSTYVSKRRETNEFNLNESQHEIGF